MSVLDGQISMPAPVMPGPWRRTSVMVVYRPSATAATMPSRLVPSVAQTRAGRLLALQDRASLAALWADWASLHCTVRAKPADSQTGQHISTATWVLPSPRRAWQTAFTRGLPAFAPAAIARARSSARSVAVSSFSCSMRSTVGACFLHGKVVFGALRCPGCWILPVR